MQIEDLLMCHFDSFFFTDTTWWPILPASHSLHGKLSCRPTRSEIHFQNQHELCGFQNRCHQGWQIASHAKLEQKPRHWTNFAESPHGNVLQWKSPFETTSRGINLLARDYIYSSLGRLSFWGVFYWVNFSWYQQYLQFVFSRLLPYLSLLHFFLIWQNVENVSSLGQSKVSVVGGWDHRDRLAQTTYTCNL